MSQHILLVKGINQAGRKFRPSDWVERLAGCGAVFDSRRRLSWHSGLRPAYIDKVKCLLVDTELEQQAPSIWRYVMEFINRNGLQVTELNAPDTPDSPGDHHFNGRQAA